MAEELTINDALTIRSPDADPKGAPEGSIDQYVLLRELGGGGFGTVYLARNTVSNVDVAVKGLPPLVRNNREELANIRTNFALVSRLHHPNIAAALDLHPANHVAYADRRTEESLRVFSGDTMMVMQYAPGVTLGVWRRQFPGGKVPFDKALTVIRQVASALDYAHAQKIIHRDVKPSNVMVETKADGSLVARVLDFGLAAEIQSSMGRISREVCDRSGTRPYMAPEQWQGRPQGSRTDLYSLAVLFCELVTGDVPFASVFACGDPMVMMTAITSQEFLPPKELPRPVRKALVRALEKDPERRFPSCSAFVQAVSLPATGGWRKKTLVALAMCAIVAAGAFIFVRDRAQREQAVAEALAAQTARDEAERKAKEEAERLAREASAHAAVREAAVQVESRQRAAQEEADRLAREKAAKAAKEKSDREEREKAERAVKEAAKEKLDRAAQGKTKQEAVQAKPVPASRPSASEILSPKEFVAVDTAKLASGTGRRVLLADGLPVEMIWCAPGKTTSGDTVEGFWLGKQEVSQDLWFAVMGERPSAFVGEKGDGRPVENISWDDSATFLEKLCKSTGTTGFRLPSESEWEYACRAGSKTDYSWGADASPKKMRVAESFVDEDHRPGPAGGYPANAWGFLDMHGNVAEWCADRFSGKGEEDVRMLKGGSWRQSMTEAAVKARTRCLSYNANATCGMRLCYSAVRPKAVFKPAETVPGQDSDGTAKHTVMTQQVETVHKQTVASLKPQQLKPGTLNRITIAAGVDLELLWCPPGAFMMGSPPTEEERILAVEDQHEVVLTKGFWMSKYEVTKGMWQVVMADDSLGFFGKEKEPKANVSWLDAMQFVERLNQRLQGVRVRLPTEAEWEYACRAGTSTVFAFGDTLDGGKACCNGNVPYGTLIKGETWTLGPPEVGHYATCANRWGLNDMHGSLFEWCSDWYAASTREFSKTDPAGPKKGDGRVIRGGCWRFAARQCRSAFRTQMDPEKRLDYIGFRICCDQLP